MAKKKRKARESTDNVDMFKPIDIEKFGSDEDPCFGKHYDLSAEECKRCGDSELCAAVFSRTNAKKLRDKETKGNRYKDMELEDPGKPLNEALLNWVKEKKEEGLKRSEIIKKAKKTFGSTRKEVKELYKITQ